MLPLFRNGFFEDPIGLALGAPLLDIGIRHPLKGIDGLMKADLKETDDGYELSVELPGFKKEDIDMQLENGVLSVRATMSKERHESNENSKFLYQERYAGSAVRNFFVGKDVKEDQINAKFEDGVLSVSFPKPEEPALPEKKTIQIAG